MADDVDAPHVNVFEFDDQTPVVEVLTHIQRSGYLASIQGGAACWSVVNDGQLAVVAQQWGAPKMFFLFAETLAKQRLVDGAVHLHFNYHAQVDPDVVYDVLRHFAGKSR